ncbi:MAG TPA: hypothetical protein VG457_13750 [Planctomycetota bacterium]|jgi:hypothetical protein|nr:hypothetical protein [Planctomycetota bacterium]
MVPPIDLIVADSPGLLHSLAHAFIRAGTEVVADPEDGEGPDRVLLTLGVDWKRPRRGAGRTDP